MPDLEIVQLDEVDHGVINDFVPLLSQLSETFDANSEIEKRAQIEANLTDMLQRDDTFVLVHRDPDSGKILSTATGNVVLEREGWVDDVVTLEEARGRKLGGRIMEGLHCEFSARGVRTIRLTSSLDRGPAGDLYSKLGYTEGGRVWRTQLSVRNILPTGSRRSSFEAVNCPVPTGRKAWVYGPTFHQDQNGYTNSLMRAHRDLRMSGASTANYFSEEPVALDLALALNHLGYQARESRLYTLELPQ